MGTAGEVSGFSFPASPLASLPFLLFVWMLFFMAPCQGTDVNDCLIIKRKKTNTHKSTPPSSITTIELSAEGKVCGPEQTTSPQPWSLQKWAFL